MPKSNKEVKENNMTQLKNQEEIKKEFETKWNGHYGGMKSATMNTWWSWFSSKLDSIRAECSDKNTKHNKIHKEGWEAGYKKGRAETVEEILKSVRRASKKYPIFANPSIGSISFDDWLKKKIRPSLTQKGQKK